MERLKAQTIKASAGPHAFGKNRINRRQYFARRAIGNGEINIIEGLAHIPDLRAENFARALEGGGISALKTEYRLFPVAHKKQRAVGCLAAAGSGKELLRQRADDFPLGK